MRVIVNENITQSVIQGLRDRGFDVLSVKESMRGADDTSILQRAEAEQRLVITQDKDFGELAFKHRLPATSGIVLFRLSADDPADDNQRMLDVMQSRSDWAGHFSVVTNDRIRMRTLPSSGTRGTP
jgi:predicted nuclease of predicted toxin-antitoxin system